MKRLSQKLGRFRKPGFLRKLKRQDAQGIVEFALVLPMLLVLIFGVIEGGRLLFTFGAVITAAREAARYGSAAGDIGNAEHWAHYQDCAGIRAAAKRIGTLVGLQDSDIYIKYDSGPGTAYLYNDCVPNMDINLDDRIVVQVIAHYQPIVPLVKIPPFPIASTARRSILKNVSIEGPPPGFLPTVQFSIASQDVNEGSNTTVEVQLNHSTNNDVIVPISVGGTATLDEDYTLSFTTQVVIPAGQTKRTIHINTIQDDTYEGNELLVLSMGEPTNAIKQSPSTHVVTIVDDDPPPVISFASASTSESEGIGTLGIDVVLDHPSKWDVNVSFSVKDGTALIGKDYTVPSYSLVIPAGETTKQFLLSIVDDTLFEDDEDLEVSILSASMDGNSITVQSPSTNKVTIENNDLPPQVSFAWDNQKVEETVGSLVVSVQLNTASGKDVTVPVQDTGGSATAGVDYNLVGGTNYDPYTHVVCVPAGTTKADIPVEIVQDTTVEPDETFTLALGTPTNATSVAPDKDTITITDGTLPTPTVSFTSPGQSGSEAVGKMTIVAQLSAATNMDVTVPFGVSGTATMGVDYSITSSPLVIPAGASSTSIVINVVNDTLDEPDETVIVTMGTPVNADPGSITAHTATILDNDLPPTVSFTSDGWGYKEDAGGVRVLVQLSAVSGKDVIVPFSISGTATQGVDYTVAPTSTLFIPAGGSSAEIVVSIIDDALVEQDESVVLSLGTPTNATRAAPSVYTLMIQDNEVCPNPGSTTEDGYQLSMDIWNSNPGAQPAVISGITIIYSKQNQSLQEVFLNGAVIWNTGDDTMPFGVPGNGSWIGGEASRTVNAPSKGTLLFLFGKQITSNDSYSVVVSFANGCSVSASR